MIDKSIKKARVMTASPLVSGAIILSTLLVVVALYWPSVDSLLIRWGRFDESYGHGFLLLAVVGWLFYELRHEVNVPTCRINLSALLVLFPAMLVWFVGRTTGIILFEQLPLPLIWWSGVWFLAGWPLAKSVLFPIFFLYFAIPIWDHLNSTLVTLSIKAESFLLGLSGLPVLVEGNQFSIPSGIITIADGCSGLRYLIIGLAFGALAARLYFSSTKMRILILLLALGLSILANWIRIYLLVLIGYYTEMRSSLMGDHEMFGFWVFGIMLIPLFILIRYRSESVAITNVSVAANWNLFDKKALFSAALLLLFVALGPMAQLLMQKSAENVVKPDMGELTALQVKTTHLPAAIFNESDSMTHRTTWQFNQGNGYVGANVRWYFQPQVGQDFLPYRTLLNRDSWVVESDEVNSDGQLYRQLVLKSVSSGKEWLIRYWIEVGGLVTVNQYIAKLAEIPALFSGRRDALVVQLFAPCDWNGCTEQALQMDALLVDKKKEFNQLVIFNNGSE